MPLCPRRGNLTLLAALSKERLQAEWVIEGSVDGDVFVTWLEHVLLPTLTPGQVVVMDNLRAHYRKEVSALVEARLHPALPTVLLARLFAYRACLLEDQGAASWTKRHPKGACPLKSLAARTKQALADAVAEACRTVGPADFAGWFKHCGYGLQ